MFRWLPYPFLRFTPFFMLGIASASQVDSVVAISALLILFLAYSLHCFFLPKRALLQYHPITTFAASIILILLGILRAQQHDSSRKANHLLHFTDTADYYIATVVDHPKPKKNSYQTTVEVDYVVSETKQQPISQMARVVVYQPKADSSQLMKFGDQVLVKRLPRLVESPKNPAEFDYQQFLAYQGIYHQQYVSAKNWLRIAANTKPTWLGLAGKWRNQCRDILLQYIPSKEAQGIALAITLGVKSHLERDVQMAYAAAGAMHVLAVSGLHVGIIYLIISFLLKPIRRIPIVGVWSHAIFCSLMLWVYAALTGFSPSVQRAAVMFTFIILAQASRRQSSIYNTLACSALGLLWYNPNLMYSVGFQLSYLAVFGIVYLQPRICTWANPRNKVVDYFWQLTAVSLAAQIATFPLGLYYFHQFPVYFWLSNIVVIPAALVMLPLGLATLATGLILPSLGEVLGVLLDTLIKLVNAFVVFIQRFPGSIIEGVSITSAQTWLLYLIIVFLLLLFHYRKLRYLSLAVTSLFLVIAIQVVSVYQQSQEMSMTIYHVKDDTHLDFTQGFTNLHLGEWNDNAEYHVLPNHLKKDFRTTLLSDTPLPEALPCHSFRGIDLIEYQGKTVALIKEQLSSPAPKQPIQIDYVIIAKNSVRNLRSIDEYFSYSQLIIDGTNSYFVAKKLAEEAEEKHITFHSVPVQGALTIHCNP